MSHTCLSWFDYVTAWCSSSQGPTFHPCSPSSLLVAQWLEDPTRSWRVVGSNPIWGSDFFRVSIWHIKRNVIINRIHINTFKIGLISEEAYNRNKRKRFETSFKYVLFKDFSRRLLKDLLKIVRAIRNWKCTR